MEDFWFTTYLLKNKYYVDLALKIGAANVLIRTKPSRNYTITMFKKQDYRAHKHGQVLICQNIHPSGGLGWHLFLKGLSINGIKI